MYTREQDTMPLETIAIYGATRFREYLARHQLNPLLVSIACGVRYLTIWNIQRGHPVSRANADRVRVGLHRLTGVRFVAPLALYVDDVPEKNRTQGEQTERRVMTLGVERS